MLREGGGVTAIVWFRRDLRLHDNPALWAACQRHEQVVPAFCFDRQLLHGRNRSVPRTRFMLGCLSELSRDLTGLGSRLFVLSGSPVRALPELAASAGAEVVFAAADVSPFARRRDGAVAAALAAAGRRLELFPGTFVVDDLGVVRSASGDPYTMFTPFYRRWLTAGRRAVLPAPPSLPAPPAAVRGCFELPELSSLRIESVPGAGPAAPGFAPAAPGSAPTAPGVGPALVRSCSWEPGERAARELASDFLSDRIESYERAREIPAEPGTTRLSPYLHFGCISARELDHELGAGDAPQALRRQLCWRDFYAHVLLLHPANAGGEHQQRYRRRIRWSRSRRSFEAWRDGRTGYPLIDAAMRQLSTTGWMHNRVRMVVGSFLVKDLGIDWRWGERWFMRMLLDGDQASNNGNWQWIASVGVDPQPVSRRIFNPTLQQRRFDPGGHYVRAYVPELGNVPDEYLAEPWTMPIELQRRLGCVIGVDYPSPIVDHAAARRAALERYARAVA